MTQKTITINQIIKKFGINKNANHHIIDSDGDVGFEKVTKMVFKW